MAHTPPYLRNFVRSGWDAKDRIEAQDSSCCKTYMVCVRAPKGELPAVNLFQPLFCPWDSIPERDGYKIEALDSAKLKPNLPTTDLLAGR